MELKLQPEKPKKRHKGQFAKGFTPWNKGKSYDMCNHSTRWSATHHAPNWVADGEIRIHRNDDRKDVMIKVPGKFMFYSRYVWQQHHGEIPSGYVIRFKDGDRLNCDISNLECISRADNARRNVNRKKAAESLIKVWKREKVRANIGLPPVSKFGFIYQKTA